MLKKIASLIYAAGAYVLFLGAFLYLMAFTLNVVPHSVSGTPTLPPLVAAMVDLALITLFGLQHGIMARPGFKAWWTKMVPPHLERSTFVWFAAILVLGIVEFWQPIGGEVWNITGPAAVALYAISVIGWIGVPVTSFLTDHFDLFGLRQVVEHTFGLPQSAHEFKERAFYKKVRHPMMLSFLIAFWAAPHMTAGHLLFAGLMTAYILVGIHFEERDLLRKHGLAYRDYQARVPKLLPFGAPRTPLAPKTETAQSHY